MPKSLGFCPSSRNAIHKTWRRTIYIALLQGNHPRVPKGPFPAGRSFFSPVAPFPRQSLRVDKIPLFFLFVIRRFVLKNPLQFSTSRFWAFSIKSYQASICISQLSTCKIGKTVHIWSFFHTTGYGVCLSTKTDASCHIKTAFLAIKSRVIHIIHTIQVIKKRCLYYLYTPRGKMSFLLFFPHKTMWIKSHLLVENIRTSVLNLFFSTYPQPL
jgi:hypothetical protein